MGLNYSILAAAEIAGRHVFNKFPALRRWASRAARKTEEKADLIELAEFKSSLNSIGVTQGDILMVHSAWDGLRNLRAKPSEVIALLLELIGPEGTLIMPTSPVPALRDNIQIYDIVKSPSSLGLLSESFRRTPGVKRGYVPFGTVSAIGPRAEIFTRNFLKESGQTAYGLGSPYHEIGRQNGKVLILGIDFIRALSLYHSAFDVLGEANPISEFYVEKPFIVVNKGNEDKIIIRRPDPKWTDYLATKAFKKIVLANSLCKMEIVNGIKINLIDAKQFLTWHLDVARKDGWPYWGFKKKVASNK